MFRGVCLSRPSGSAAPSAVTAEVAILTGLHQFCSESGDQTLARDNSTLTLSGLCSWSKRERTGHALSHDTHKLETGPGQTEQLRLHRPPDPIGF